MEKQPIFKSATELNLAIKMAKIADDAVSFKTGTSSSDLILNEILDGRKKKTITAGRIDDIIQMAQGLIHQGKSGSFVFLKIIGIAAMLYGSLAAGKRIANLVRNQLGLDPYNKGNLPDPYENIEEPYKWKEELKPNKTREVYPGYYEPTSHEDQWRQDVEKRKFWDAGQKSGVPAQFGTSPGFYVDKYAPNNQFSNALDKLKEENYKQASEQEDGEIKTAQSAGSFTTKNTEPMSDNYTSSFKNFISPSNWEQFLSQGAGEWAAAPSPEASFFDTSGALGRNRPMEWKPIGYGQESVQSSMEDMFDYKKSRFDALRGVDPSRRAARSIYLMRLVDVKEQQNVLDPNQAAILRNQIVQLQQEGSPETFEQVSNMIEQGIGGGAFSIPNMQDPTTRQTSFDLEALKKDPLNNPMHQNLMDHISGSMSEYREEPLYQRTIQPSSSTLEDTI